MESFKKCEKETKTKPYSKEALRLKMEEMAREAAALTPEQNEANEWMEDQMAALQEQVESLESELDKLEKVAAKSSKKRKKKEQPVGEEQQQMTERLDKNKWHLNQLKRCQERIVNDEVDPMLYKDIQDDVEYYIESFEDEVLYHIAEMYHPITEAPDEDHKKKKKTEVGRAPRGRRRRSRRSGTCGECSDCRQWQRGGHCQRRHRVLHHHHQRDCAQKRGTAHEEE